MASTFNGQNLFISDEIAVKQFELIAAMLHETDYNKVLRALTEGYLCKSFNIAIPKKDVAKPFGKSFEDHLVDWSKKTDGVLHYIIASFLYAGGFDSNFVSRNAMIEFFTISAKLKNSKKTEEVFLRNFRMLCSQCAYGGILFVYNNKNDSVKVSTDNLYEKLLSLSDNFRVEL